MRWRSMSTLRLTADTGCMLVGAGTRTVTSRTFPVRPLTVFGEMISSADAGVWQMRKPETGELPSRLPSCVSPKIVVRKHYWQDYSFSRGQSRGVRADSRSIGEPADRDDRNLFRNHRAFRSSGLAGGRNRNLTVDSNTWPFLIELSLAVIFDPLAGGIRAAVPIGDDRR